MINDIGTPVRRAALLLHAMAPADRDWVLTRLPANGRAGLETLLRELGELGIPRDSALLEQVVTVKAHAAEPNLDAPDRAALFTAIAAADPARLAIVLRDEPVDLVAMLLAARDWTWRGFRAARSIPR